MELARAERIDPQRASSAAAIALPVRWIADGVAANHDAAIWTEGDRAGGTPRHLSRGLDRAV